MLNVVLLSLMLISAVIHHGDCFPQKGKNVKRQDQLMHLLHREHSRGKERETYGHFLMTLDKRTAIGKSDTRSSSCGSEPVESTASSGTITSPGYETGLYPNNALCRWQITAPAGNVITATFNELSLESHSSCLYDSVTLYDGSSASSTSLGKFCTATTTTITSSGSSLFVVFRSDSSINNGGFSLSWTFVPRQTPDTDVSACSGSPTELTASSGVIRSPGYATSTYPNKVDCRWRITAPSGMAVSAKFDELSIETHPTCNYDRVTFYDGSSDVAMSLGSFCAASTSTIISSGSSLFVVFHSDVSNNNGRFSLSWTFIPQLSPACSGKRLLELRETSGTIQSPGYVTSTYPNNADCHWQITAPHGKAVAARFNELSLEVHADCIHDKVTFYDGSSIKSPSLGKFCAATTSTITSSGSSLFVVFQSDSSVNNGRFSLSWTFVSSSYDQGNVTCGQPAIKPVIPSFTRIVGGIEARRNSWPWQCRLMNVGCGASIISNRYILTAAHCFFWKNKETGIHYRIPDSAYVVVCGLHDKTQLSDPAIQRFTGVTVVLHKNYIPSRNDWDIAVIRLPGELNFNKFVQPVCLPSTPVGAGTNCVVTGWGATEGTGSNDVLRQVVVPTISLQDCRALNYNFRIQLTENMMCAGFIQGGKDSCQGDSGGPLVCKQGDIWYEYGVVSWGYGCAEEKKPGVYTNVVSLLDWIKQQTGIGASGTTAERRLIP